MLPQISHNKFQTQQILIIFRSPSMYRDYCWDLSAAEPTTTCFSQSYLSWCR